MIADRETLGAWKKIIKKSIECNTMNTKPNVLIYSSNSKYLNKSVGGAETSLRLIADKLAKNGINVSYLTGGITRIPGLTKKKINGVNVYFFTSWRWPLFSNRLFPSFAFSIIRKQKRRILARLIKQNNIDIVHTYDTFPETFDIIKLRRDYNLRFKIVQRISGLHWTNQIKGQIIDPETIEHVFNNVDMLNFISSDLKELFYNKCHELGITPVPVNTLVHDIGVDFNYYNGKKKHPANKRFTIICAARFSKRAKRQDLLINAVKKLKGQNIFVEFAGDGEMLKKYKQEIKKASLGHMVNFHGYITKEKLKELLKSSDLFALPTDYEGVSKSMLEAMSTKLPVLVSDIVPLNRYIKNNKTGFLVENEPEKWSEIILKLYGNQRLLSEVAEAGYHFAYENYNADINILKYIEAFQNI